MDPFSALSIAAAVIQFVDFTSALLKEYKEIRQAGQPLTFEAFEQTSNDILKLNESLKNSTKSRYLPKTAELAEHELVRAACLMCLFPLTLQTINYLMLTIPCVRSTGSPTYHTRLQQDCPRIGRRSSVAEAQKSRSSRS